MRRAFPTDRRSQRFDVRLAQASAKSFLHLGLGAHVCHCAPDLIRGESTPREKGVQPPATGEVVELRERLPFLGGDALYRCRRVDAFVDLKLLEGALGDVVPDAFATQLLKDTKPGRPRAGNLGPGELPGEIRVVEKLLVDEPGNDFFDLGPRCALLNQLPAQLSDRPCPMFQQAQSSFVSRGLGFHWLSRTMELPIRMYPNESEQVRNSPILLSPGRREEKGNCDRVFGIIRMISDSSDSAVEERRKGRGATSDGHGSFRVPCQQRLSPRPKPARRAYSSSTTSSAVNF